MSYPPAQFPPGASAATADDLTLPLRGATIGQAVTRFFKNYATFSGRASRSEFWWWSLVSGLVGLVFYTLDFASSGGFIEASETNGTFGDLLS